jgi:hypothetical protein
MSPPASNNLVSFQYRMGVFREIGFASIKLGGTLVTFKGYGGCENHTENLIIRFHNLLVLLEGLHKKIDPLFKLSLW